MRRRKKSDDSGFNVWRSYSDMMAGVLLLFILIMCVTLFQAQKSYNESIKERDDKIALQEQYTAEILAQQTELDEKDSKLSSQDEQLDKQKKLLAELAAQLKEQQATLDQQQSDLDEKTSLLATQQKKIDNIIGVKADVIEALQKEFSKNNVSVDIDAQTGALTLNANVMFDYDQSELTDEGKEELANILPIYCKVLLQDDYKKYLAEIIIDGYTDTDGDYDYNLELSQKRSLAVAQYLTEIRENFLSADEISDLQNYLTVNGHGSANPILDSKGNEDKDASRRVEVKFRLKDDEMISELDQIMKADADTNTNTEASADKASDSKKSSSN
nr:OmpA family protein [uncultured Blautia sp.]